MKRWIKWLVCAALLCAMLLSSCAGAEKASRNPLLTPPVIGEYVQTEDEFLNILLLGIDYGGRAYPTSGGKKALEECHTDGAIVVALNRTKGEIDLISIPRDALTYVPGVLGIYKFNGAINCAQTLEEGLARTCQAASWHLGGIRIDRYVAIDATALVELGNAIGGVDFEVDMNYEGTHGFYRRGLQHLDGYGIFDYMCARTNATKDANDLGRTRRQRDMLSAIFAKLKKEPALLLKALAVYTEGKVNILTDFSVTDALAIAQTALSLDMERVQTHVLTGAYKAFMKNFTFVDQENRQQVIEAVFGVSVEPMPYVDYRYTTWLTGSGLLAAKSINIGRSVLAHAQKTAAMTQEQQDAYAELDEAVDACIDAFDAAADSGSSRDTDVMMIARQRLKKAASAAAEAFAYPENLRWARLDDWYNEIMINEYQLNWN